MHVVDIDVRKTCKYGAIIHKRGLHTLIFQLSSAPHFVDVVKYQGVIWGACFRREFLAVCLLV